MSTGSRCVLLLAFATSLSGHAAEPWFRVSKEYVSSHYASDSAIGTLTSNRMFPGPEHIVPDLTCGKNDFEIHLGVPDGKIERTSAGPVNALASGSAGQWGVVAEPPNIKAGARDAFDAIATKQVVFTGYYRIWNEGHYTQSGQKPNPRHIMEFHPAWAWRVGNHNTNNVARVAAMKQYAGYGASKFRKLLEDIAAKKTLQAYQFEQFLFLQMPRGDNFYQLPVLVKEVHDVAGGGKEATVDVFSDAAHTHLVFGNLRVVTAGAAPAAHALVPNKKTFLLGIFSVNARKAIALSQQATKTNPADVRDALEFFTFGRAKNPAVADGQCHAEGGDE